MSAAESGAGRVLVVDDEEAIRDLAAMYLESEGFQALRAPSGPRALERIAIEDPDLVLLDIMLPGMDGWEVCRRVRAVSDVPIIMLTARGDPLDRVRGLELGADDYVVKPFHGRELVARVKAVLRRGSGAGVGAPDETDEVLRLGDVEIDPAGRTVTVAGRDASLRARELDLLEHLARHVGLVQSRAQLLERVWGYDYLGDSRTVDVHVAHLRAHIKDSRRLRIQTVWGIGYKLMVDEAEAETEAEAEAETDREAEVDERA